MSGPRDWVRRMLSDTEQEQLLDMAAIGWEPLANQGKLSVVEAIARASLISLGFLDWRKRFWIFGAMGVAITAKGRRWAAHLEQGETKW